MKNKILVAVSIVSFVLLGVYIVYQDSLPPRTPHKVARLISKLSIPSSSKVIKFEDQWNDFNGNGFSFIILQLDDNSFKNIYQEAKAKGYKELPIDRNIGVPLEDVFKKKLVGIYKINVEDKTTMSFNSTILSSEDKEVLIYLSTN